MSRPLRKVICILVWGPKTGRLKYCCPALTACVSACIQVRAHSYCGDGQRGAKARARQDARAPHTLPCAGAAVPGLLPGVAQRTAQEQTNTLRYALASKSHQACVSWCYRHAFLRGRCCALSTLRSGWTPGPRTERPNWYKPALSAPTCLQPTDPLHVSMRSCCALFAPFSPIALVINGAVRYASSVIAPTCLTGWALTSM